MSEASRTTMYIAIAAVALLLAWFVRPATVRFQPIDDSGERFFEQFEPLDAKSLEIVAINPETLQRRTFKVAHKNGRWSIPSREDYPADAQDQVAKAAVSVMDLMKGSVVSDSPADHDLFGVADPASMSGAQPSIGSGTRVTLQTDAGRTLVDLILGKAVKDSENLRYVRVPGRDRVYTAAVNTDSLSTRFEDWIELDLLKLSGMPISEIVLDDYSIDEVNQRVVRGERVAVLHDPASNSWSVTPPESLKEGETVDIAKVEELRNGLSSLQIVDVHRKPAGLSSQLMAQGEMMIDGEAIASLANRGYYISNGQLLSNEGETIVRTPEGAEYVLRFGETIHFETGTIAGEDVSASQPESGRFVFVTVNFNPALIKQPQYEALPESAPEGDDAAEFEQIRQGIIQANDSKRAEYEGKLAAGEEMVKKLSARFAEWYYVVSEDMYRQIRLKRNDIVHAAVE